jgi:hypothetical protein
MPSSGGRLWRMSHQASANPMATQLAMTINVHRSQRSHRI